MFKQKSNSSNKKVAAMLGGIWGLISGGLSFWLEATAAFSHKGFATFEWYEIILLFPGWVFDRINYFVDISNIFIPVPTLLYYSAMYIFLPLLTGVVIGITINKAVKYVVKVQHG
jgi:hypothetical protein